VQETSPQLLVVYAAAILAVALIGARYLASVRSDSTQKQAHSVLSGGEPAGSASSSGGGPSAGAGFAAPVVYVSGAVRRPGIVRLRRDDRVADAIAAAGGARRSADLGAVNLAARIADGQQIVVPRRLGSAAAGARGGASAAAGPISLSSATAEQLDSLDGVGPGLAQKILDYRTQHGGFRSVDELGEVPGIGEKRLESLRAQLTP